MARNPRANATGWAMVVAMAVLVVPVLAITWLFTRDPAPQVESVDYRSTAERAAAASDFEILVPQGLPDTWTATKAMWMPAGMSGQAEPVVGDTWTLGFLTPDRMFIGLDQRVVAPAQFVAQKSRDGRPDGESSVAGTPWTRLVSADDRTRSLVRPGDGRDAPAVVISGDLPYEALEAFASTLGPVA